MQLVQLQQAKPLFEALGFKVAALSYDSPPLLDEFAQRKGIDYPLISDKESLWLKQAGLLNAEAAGMLKGVSLPATVITNRDLIVTHIFRESAYQDRITPASLLEVLQGGTAPEAREEVTPEKPQVTTSQSDTKVTAGSLFVATVHVALPRGYHMYAPGAPDVIPVSLTFEPHPLLEVTTVNFPPAHTETLLDQEVPVYEGRTSLRALVKVRSDKETRPRLPELSQLPLKATLEYQCCTDSLCLAPISTKLQWRFEYLPLDLERSSEALQHHE